MKVKNKTHSHMSVFIAMAALACSVGMTAPAVAGPKVIKLATPQEAMKACQSHKIGEWTLGYIIGKDGLAQWGWGNGYNCKQSPVPGSFSGVGDAIDASGMTVSMATPEEALKACHSHQIGEWDLDYIIGKGGLVQWGWGAGYNCKQSPVPGSFSGVGGAIAK